MFEKLYTLKKILKLYCYARPYLSRGIFYINLNQISKKRVLNVKSIPIINMTFKKRGNDRIEFKKGACKNVLITKDYTYCIYRSKDWYLRSKNLMIKNKDFNYDYNPILYFNDKKLTTVQKTIYGSDPSYDFLLDYLVKKIRDARIIYDKETERFCYLQHGDVREGNVFLTDKNNIVFIDNDDIRIRPLLHDCFRTVVTYNKGLEGIFDFKNKYNSFISIVLNKKHIKYTDQFFDLYLSTFVKTFLRFPSQIYLDVSPIYWLRNGNIKKFPITYQFLLDLKHNIDSKI